MDGIPLRVFRAHPNTTARKGWAAGDACMRAVQLALIVRSGQQGSPSVLSAPRWGFCMSLILFIGTHFVRAPAPFIYASGFPIIENFLFCFLPITCVLTFKLFECR